MTVYLPVVVSDYIQGLVRLNLATIIWRFNVHYLSNYFCEYSPKFYDISIVSNCTFTCLSQIFCSFIFLV